MPSQSKTAQRYGQEVQLGAWWAIQRTGGPGEEWDEVLGLSIDSISASQLPGMRRVLQSYSPVRMPHRLSDAVVCTKQMSTEVESRCHKCMSP